jgi:hypothetical protein
VFLFLYFGTCVPDLIDTQPAVFNSQLRMFPPVNVKRIIISKSDFTECLEEIGYLPKQRDEETFRLNVVNTKVAEYNRSEISFVLLQR